MGSCSDLHTNSKEIDFLSDLSEQYLIHYLYPFRHLICSPYWNWCEFCNIKKTTAPRHLLFKRLWDPWFFAIFKWIFKGAYIISCVCYVFLNLFLRLVNAFIFSKRYKGKFKAIKQVIQNTHACFSPIIWILYNVFLCNHILLPPLRVAMTFMCSFTQFYSQPRILPRKPVANQWAAQFKKLASVSFPRSHKSQHSTQINCEYLM